jgi:hypothetical protein
MREEYLQLTAVVVAEGKCLEFNLNGFVRWRRIKCFNENEDV